MADTTMLKLLKIDLQITSDKIDDLLVSILDGAETTLEGTGIRLEGTVEDDNLIRMYAAYLYRRRKDGDSGMPRMLRLAINNRLFGQRGRG